MKPIFDTKIEIPNIDDFSTDPNDLVDLQTEFNLIAAGFKELANYCEAKSAAMQCRLKGKIPEAYRFEAAADMVYRRLPEWARW